MAANMVTSMNEVLVGQLSVWRPRGVVEGLQQGKDEIKRRTATSKKRSGAWRTEPSAADRTGGY